MLLHKIKVYLFKRKLYSRLKSVGDNFMFDIKSVFLTPGEIEIGNNVFIGPGAYIAASVKIGNNVMFGPFARIIGGNHYFGVMGNSNRFLKAPNRENMVPINIEDEVWCGTSVIILGGINLHIGAIVGAGSVVNKSLPPFTMCAGNPCKPIKLIFSDTDLLQHLKKLGYINAFAQNVVERRKDLIASFNLNIDKLGIINNTDNYLLLYRNAKGKGDTIA